MRGGSIQVISAAPVSCPQAHLQKLVKVDGAGAVLVDVGDHLRLLYKTRTS